MEFLKISKGLMSLYDYIEERGLEIDLAHLQARAAKEALTKAQIALDQRSQLWSVINHLESAEVALESYVSRGLLLKASLRPATLDVAKSDLVYIRTIMSVCYIYLGEKNLALRTLDKLDESISRIESVSDAEGLGSVVVMTATLPLVLVDFLVAGGGSRSLSGSKAVEEMKSVALQFRQMAEDLSGW
jgi:hypothetical protein